MDELNERRLTTLEKMRPACIALMKDGTRANFKTLMTRLHEIPYDVAQEIQMYILFPLQNILHQKNVQEILLGDCCDALQLLLSKTKVETMQVFFDIFKPVLYHLCDPENPSKVANCSEDTKRDLVKSVTSLIKASNDRVLQDIYSLQFMPALGQLVTILLALAKLEKARDLQVTALDCLLSLLQANSKYANEVHLGDFFAFSLPGISIATCQVITGDAKQGYAVLAKAINVFTRIVLLTMSDSLLDKSQGKLTTKAAIDITNEKLASLAIERNSEWVKATASKLDQLVTQVCSLASHSNWRVRLSLAEMCENILVSCSKSMSQTLPKLLEALVGLIGDGYGNVAKKAQSALQTFSSTQSGESGARTLTEMLEENLHNLATSLPRQIRMCDEEDKSALINLLNGYITLLGPNISCVIQSAPHLQRLSLALVQALELDTSDIKIFEERATFLNKETFVASSPSEIRWPKKYFKHFRDESVLSGLLQACRNLGRYGNVYLLVDKFLDLYQESWLYRPASVLIINHLVLGAGEGRDGEKSSIQENVPEESVNDLTLIHDVIKMLLDEYLSPVNLKLVDSFSENLAASTTSTLSSSSLSSSLSIVAPRESMEVTKNLANRSKAVLLSCLFMEGVSTFATVLGKNFNTHLIQSLYPLMENLSHENIHMSSSAYCALVEICQACGYSSLDNLIQENADYLVNSVSLRLRHFEKSKRTPKVLCVMLRYCSCDLLPLVEHSITEILDSLDDHYTDELVLFMPVLLELTAAVGRWYPCSTGNEKLKSNSPRTRPAVLNSDEIVAFIGDYIKNKKIADGDFNDTVLLDSSEISNSHGERTLSDIEADMKKLMSENKTKEGREDEQEAGTEDEETKGVCPKHIQVVKDVFQRIKNLLSSHDARVRVQAIDVLCQGCHDMRDYERELLPQVHQLWPGFYPRFRSEEKFVVIKAVNALRVMCEICGDFLRPRIMKDVMPGMSVFMEKQASISSGSHSAYTHTGNYKLQLALLTSLGTVARTLQLSSRHLHTVAHMCLPYLSSLQPQPLQQASMEAFSAFISLDADAIWLLLCQCFCPCSLTAPGPDFAPVKFILNQEEKNVCAKNIQQLFSSFYH